MNHRILDAAHIVQRLGNANLVRVAVANEALLLELHARDEPIVHVADAHDAAVVDVELADDEVVHRARDLVPLVFLAVCRAQPDDTCRPTQPYSAFDRLGADRRQSVPSDMMACALCLTLRATSILQLHPCSKSVAA